jgi:membrane protease YdiL (CAAX protease family)
LWGTSLVFALTHANVATFLPLTFLAMVLVFLYERTGNLLAPIAAHSLFNAANYFALIYQDDLVKLLHFQP